MNELNEDGFFFFLFVSIVRSEFLEKDEFWNVLFSGMERNKRDVFEILIVIRRSDVSDVSFSSSEIFMESEVEEK